MAALSTSYTPSTLPTKYKGEIVGLAVVLWFSGRVFLPRVGRKGCAVQVGQGPGEAGLQAQQVVFDGAKFKGGGHGGFGREKVQKIFSVSGVQIQAAALDCREVWVPSGVRGSL